MMGGENVASSGDGDAEGKGNMQGTYKPIHSLALPSCFLDGVFYMYFVMIEDDSEDGLRKALTFMGTAEFLQVTSGARYCSFRYVQGALTFNLYLLYTMHYIHASSAGRPA